MEEELKEKLHQIPLFQDIDEEAFESLVKICSIKNFKKGQQIIREGDRGDVMYVVYHGGVTIQKKTRAGDQYTVVNLKADDHVFFGEMALAGGSDQRSATVTASEDSDFIVIHKKDFIKFGDEHPNIGLPITRRILVTVAERLRKTSGDMLTIFDALVNEINS